MDTKLIFHSWVAIDTMPLKGLQTSLSDLEDLWCHAAHVQPETTGQPPLSPKTILMFFLHFGGILSRDKQVTLCLRQWNSGKSFPRQWFHLIFTRNTQPLDLRLRRNGNESILVASSPAKSCSDSVGEAPLWISSKSFSCGTSVTNSWNVGPRGVWSIWTDLEKTAEKTKLCTKI